MEVDTTGRTIVMTCEREQAEFGRDQIHGYGADPRMPRSKGSMSAMVEPAGGPDSCYLVSACAAIQYPSRVRTDRPGFITLTMI